MFEGADRRDLQKFKMKLATPAPEQPPEKSADTSPSLSQESGLSPEEHRAASPAHWACIWPGGDD